MKVFQNKRMKKPIQMIETADLDILKSHFETITFSSEFDLVYEKQIPNIGIILVDGGIDLLNKRNHIELKSPGSILGLQNLLNNIPLKFKCRVKKNSQLILLPKSEIMRILDEKTSDLYKIIFPTDDKKLAG